MTRTRILPAAAVLLFALAGCSSGGDPKPAAAPTSASPSPSGPDDRATCRTVADLGNAFEFDATKNQQAAAKAALSTNPGIARAGAKLADAAGQASMTGGSVDDNLAIAQAQLDIAEACASLFGDGPW